MDNDKRFPDGVVKYIEIFRPKFFRYANLVKIMKSLHPNREGLYHLDLGCGTGGFAFAMADEGYKVLGTDISVDSINIAKSRSKEKDIKNIEFIVDDFKDPKIKGKFDLITILHIPLSLADIRNTVAKYKDNLNEGGLIVQIYLKKSANIVRDIKMDADQHIDPDGKFKVVRFNQWAVEDYLLKVNFMIFIDENGSTKIMFDNDQVPLVPKNSILEHELFEVVNEIPTLNEESAPPFTEEFLQVLSLKKN